MQYDENLSLADYRSHYLSERKHPDAHPGFLEPLVRYMQRYSTDMPRDRYGYSLLDYGVRIWPIDLCEKLLKACINEQSHLQDLKELWLTPTTDPLSHEMKSPLNILIERCSPHEKPRMVAACKALERAGDFPLRSIGRASRL